jgi:hypothetical protein
MTPAVDGQLFSSRDRFRDAFETGLEKLLDNAGLNLFILVCANASFHPPMFEKLRDGLHRRYRVLLDRVRHGLADGAHIDEADDDLLVFLKMATIGFDALTLTEQRNSGGWELQFNHLRSFRPLRNSRHPVASLRRPFDEHGFHFNKPFMQQELVWSGRMLGQQADLYYNKFPFADLHCLLVPDRERCLPQFLESRIHDYAWRLAGHLAETMPGARIAYNALGASASVNHLHLQWFIRDSALPVEDPRWAHNGGAELYPVTCRVFEDPRASWKFVNGLQESNRAFNLLYAPGRLYCLVRKQQGTFALPAWSGGFSWYELSGGLITFNRDAYRTLDASSIHAVLARASGD